MGSGSASPYFRRDRHSRPEGVRDGGSLLRWGIMADSTPSARLDLMTDLACVLLSAAGGMLLLVSSVGAQGAGWIHGPAPVVFGVDAGIGVLASAMLWFRRRWPVEVAVAMLV